MHVLLARPYAWWRQLLPAITHRFPDARANTSIWVFTKTALKTLAMMGHLLESAVADHPPGKHTAAIDYDALTDDVEALRAHPYVADLRGLGLEVVAAVLLRARGWEDVRLGWSVPFKDTTREVDVMGKRSGDDEIHVVECKAAHEAKDLEPAHVRKFFAETVPAVLKAYQGTKSCQAEIWTTGRVGDAARRELAGIALAKRVKPALLEKADILSVIPSTLSPCKRLIKVLRVGAKITS